MEALPQALTYMLDGSKSNQPKFGFLVNGREFVFVKLQPENIPIYDRYYSLSIRHTPIFFHIVTIHYYPFPL